MKKLKSSIQESRNWSTVLKMVLIGVLLLVFLIPLQMIRALVEERNMTRLEAEGEIIGMWGGEQIIAGPMLVVPYLKRVKLEDGKLEEYVEQAYFLPDTVGISGSVDTDKRNRGIYEVTVYTADLQVTGIFSQPDLGEWRIAEEDVFWQDAALIVELPDMRGLQERVTLWWDSRDIPFSAGQGEVGLYSGEIRAPLDWESVQQSSGSGAFGDEVSETPGIYGFSFNLHLQGGRSLSFMPLGEETRVRLTSPWSSPSFNGAFLPSERSLGDEGFEADWYVLSLNRGYGQQWLRGEVETDALLDSVFGVELMIPVDTYLKSLRSVKYGILFVLLPFLIFFLFEVASGRRVHPFQYLLAGLAVCLFYLLLVSVSEHLSFDWTYLLASLATIALITFYSSAVLAAWRRAWAMALVLAASYLFLYVALKSEDFALLIGSLGLFVILTGVMVLTRRIDWYSVGPRRNGASKVNGDPSIAGEKPSP
ncbi:MAG: cell envelope integrity protein CreD [Spirochaetaceae bacterium]|nr:MAG: cell envelope integrity protein CreD [Spirochaetaceae bacterium]